MSALLSLTRSPTIDHIADLALDGSLITLGAEQADEAIAVCTLALERMPAVARLAAVDLGRCDSTSAFVREFAGAVVGLYMTSSVWLSIPPESRSEAARDGLVELGTTVGSDLVRIVDEDDLGDADPAEVFGLAVDALLHSAAGGRPTVLAFFGVDELAPTPRRRSALSDVTALLWTLRGRLQHGRAAPGLIFAGGDAAEELISNRDSPFFGWGAHIALEPLVSLQDALQRTLEDQGLAPDTARAWSQTIERLSEGSVLLAERLVEATLREESVAHSETAPVDAWMSLLNNAAPAMRQTIRSLRYLDRLALPVVMALARGTPPYAVDKFPSGPSRALQRLRLTGFVVQHKPREWRLTDPLLAAWVRQAATSGRYAFGRPTFYVVRRDARTFEVTDAPSRSRVRSTHRTIERAEQAARQLSKEAPGSSVVIVDSEDPADLPSWAFVDDGPGFPPRERG